MVLAQEAALLFSTAMPNFYAVGTRCIPYIPAAGRTGIRWPPPPPPRADAGWALGRAVRRSVCPTATFSPESTGCILAVVQRLFKPVQIFFLPGVSAPMQLFEYCQAFCTKNENYFLYLLTGSHGTGYDKRASKKGVKTCDLRRKPWL